MREIAVYIEKELNRKVEAAKEEFWRRGEKCLSILTYRIETEGGEIILVSEGVGCAPREVGRLADPLAADIAALRTAKAAFKGLV